MSIFDDQFAEMEAWVAVEAAKHEAWVATPLPPHFHSCAKYVGRAGVIDGTFIRRCACGSMLFTDGIALDKNTARKYHRQQRAKRGYPKRGFVPEAARSATRLRRAALRAEQQRAKPGAA